MSHPYVLYTRDTSFWLIGPFDTQEAAATFGQDPQHNPDDDPRWQTVTLEEDFLRHPPICLAPHHTGLHSAMSEGGDLVAGLGRYTTERERSAAGAAKAEAAAPETNLPSEVYAETLQKFLQLYSTVREVTEGTHALVTGLSLRIGALEAEIRRLSPVRVAMVEA